MTFIRAENLNLDYPILGVTQQSFKKQFLRVATGGLIAEEGGVPIVKALQNVSFRLEKGDRLALIGHNGAGKSTLLRAIAGIFTPSSGQISTQGRIVSTLNISVGLELEATGYENLITRGILLGLKRSEIEKQLPDIAAFTELGDYLSMPVRVYSTGMMMRLAFGVVTSLDADILLMDEVIGTGDSNFVKKAEARLHRFMNRAGILVLASHNEEILRQLCNKALLLEKGTVKQFGSLDDVLSTYHKG